MSEDVKNFLEELKEYSNGGISGLYPPEETVKEFVNYVEQLQQKNKELKNTNASLQSALSLSRQKYNNDKQRYRRKYKKEHNILIEFKKWLEEDFKNETEHPTPQIYCNCYSCKIKILDKLQELKGRNNIEET